MITPDSPINVALVTSAYPLGGREVVGGVEGVCSYLADALAAHEGVRVHLFLVFAERYGIHRYTSRKKNHLTIHAIPSMVRRSHILNYLRVNPAAVINHASEIKFDLIHFQNDALWAARASLPAVLTIHGINERDVLFRGSLLTRFLRGWINRALNRQIRLRVRNIIAISPYVRRVLKPSDRQRIWDIENPVADSYFEVVRKPVAGRMLFAGRIAPIKNITGLIEAFAQTAKTKPNCELRLAGPETDVAYAKRCRELAAQLGVAGRVKYLGSLSIEEMKIELASTSFLVLCSFQENAPLVISEAMAAGVPVVASKVGGVPWMVADGSTGYLVDPNLSGDITRGLQRAFDTKEPSAMGYRAKTLAEQRFRPRAVAQKTEDVYQQILHRGNPAE